MVKEIPSKPAINQTEAIGRYKDKVDDEGVIEFFKSAGFEPKKKDPISPETLADLTFADPKIEPSAQ
ncbi:MAG: hypothetical protein KBC12_03650 [Candidatus Pacebacteria bacterium]|nr:hypothetical protein [Candidatus Paceibacterota bacterium]